MLKLVDAMPRETQLASKRIAKPDIFRRIALIHPPAPSIESLLRSDNPLRGYLVENLGGPSHVATLRRQDVVSARKTQLPRKTFGRKIDADFTFK